MSLKQIIERLNTLCYVIDSVSTEEEQTGLFIFFSQYKSILGQCNKLYSKDMTIKRMLLNTFKVREVLHKAKAAEAKYALQSEIKVLINLIRHIDQFGKPPLLQLGDPAGNLKTGASESQGRGNFS